jgi:hypothetical protein
MVAQERAQAGHVGVAGLGQMCLALCQDGLRILTNQGPNRCEVRFWGRAFLPAVAPLTQQSDEGIRLLRMLTAVLIQGFLGCMRPLLQKPEEHLSQVIQGLGRPDADQRHRSRQTLPLLRLMPPGNIPCSGFVGKTLELCCRPTFERMVCGMQRSQPPDMRQMFTETFGRGLSGGALETLPRTGPIGVITAQDT